MPDPTNFEWRLRWLVVGVLVVYWGVIFAGTHLQFSGPALPYEPGDKTLHFVAYAGLAFLWLAAAASFGRVSWLMYVVVMLGAAVYGAVDEVSQSLVGRDTDLADWRFDLLGSALGTMAFAGIYAAWNLWLGPKDVKK